MDFSGKLLADAEIASTRAAWREAGKKVVFTKDGDCIWQCSNCGHIVVGRQAPDVCPVCDHPQSFFRILAQNY